MSRKTPIACLMALGLSTAAARAQETTQTFDGPVPDDGAEHFLIPFDVPAGTFEIEIRHDDLSEGNILDWGLAEPDGAFRGWGGGNTEPAVVGIDAASRSYLTGRIPTGTWNVVVGKAKIAAPPGQYQVEVADPFSLEALTTAPAEGQDRWRVEVLGDGHPATITSHVWHEDGPGGEPAPGAETAADGGGCGCRTHHRHSPRGACLALIACLALVLARRR